MLSFQPKSSIQYHSYIIQSNRSLHTEAMCHCDLGTSRWDEKVHLSVYNTGSDDKQSKLYSLNLKVQATNVVNGYYEPFFLSYSDIL